MEVLTRTSLIQLVEKGRVIGFGAGDIGEATVRSVNRGFPYFVDNEPTKHQHNWIEGIPVHAPARLQEEPAGTTVVVCSDRYPEIEAQVRALNPGLVCYLCPLLKDVLTLEKVTLCSQRILVSAYHVGGGLYLVNGRHRKFRCLGKGAFRGLAVAEGRLFVVEEAGHLWEITSLEPFHKVLRYTQPAYNNAHGLAYWREGKAFLVAETSHDRIALFSASSFERIGQIELDTRPGRAANDHYHVNDLCVIDNALFYTVFSRTGWYRRGVSDGAVLSRPVGQQGEISTVLSGLHSPHSVRFVDGQLIVLESSQGDVTSGRGLRLAHLPGYLRGLDGSRGLLYLGQSRHRRLDLCSNPNTISMDSGLHIVDSSNRISRFVHLPTMCDVYDVLDLENPLLGLFPG